MLYNNIPSSLLPSFSMPPSVAGAAGQYMKIGALKAGSMVHTHHHTSTGKLNGAEISLPSPPSSTASSLDNDHLMTGDSFMSNGEYCSFDSDIILEDCKILSPNDPDDTTTTTSFADVADVRQVLAELVDRTVEEAIQDEVWAKVVIDFDGETILPNGRRLVRGVASMDYYRDDCSTPRFTNQLNYLKAILQKNILRYKAAMPFLHPVDSVALKIPHYYQIVRQPMDLNTIKHRLNFLYYRSGSECIADIRLILENCFKFNTPQDFVYKSGKKFEEFLNEKLKDMPVDEVEIACPAMPNPDEYFKEKDTRLFKRVDPILQEVASRTSMVAAAGSSSAFSTPKMEAQAASKYSTRSASGVKARKPTKDLTTYTEALAAASSSATTPEMPKPRFGKKIPLNDALRWCLDFVKELFTKQHEAYAWPFYKPVDLKQFPDYTRAIKSPIDLSTIKNLIETGGYETVTRFATAMRLMFSNCIRYNPPESPIIEQARKLRDLFELRFANIPEEFLKMKLDLPSKSTPSSSRNVSPSSSRSKSSKLESYVPPPLPVVVEKVSKKRKDKDREERREAKKLKRSSSSHEKAMEQSPMMMLGAGEVGGQQSFKLEELQNQINTLTLALKTALQGGGAANEAKKLLDQVTQGSVPSPPMHCAPAKRPRKEKATKATPVPAKRGPKPKPVLGRPRHLSSSESDSDSDEETSSFHPTSREDLTKLKADLEELPASDIHCLLSILRETEPSLQVDDTNIEIDFETLSSQTLIRMRKYVDSVMLNMRVRKSSTYL